MNDGRRRGRGTGRPQNKHQRCTVGDTVFTAASKEQMVQKLEGHGYAAQRAKNDVEAQSYFQAAEHFKKDERHD